MIDAFRHAARLAVRWRWAAWWVVPLALVRVLTERSWLAGLVVLWVATTPLVVAVTWAAVNPASYERLVATPHRRWHWRRTLRRRWPDLAQACSLTHWVYGRGHLLPRLVRVGTTPTTITADLMTATGQTPDRLLAGLPALATTMGAVHHAVQIVGPSRVRVTLVMWDALAVPRDAPPLAMTDDVDLAAVPVGRTVAGDPWTLDLASRHLLVAGCSGSGKSSLIGTLALALAPAIGSGRVRLHVIDLKHGVEVAHLLGLASTIATTPDDAVALLRWLAVQAQKRGQAMASRRVKTHTATPRDPHHVLVIDEVAMLTAYGDAEARKQAALLLPALLATGRALGFTVVGALQDPRREVLGARGLFTDGIAFALRSETEVGMVLGDDAAETAPAHRLTLDTPGMAYHRSADRLIRVRSDWASDESLAEACSTHRVVPTPVPARYYAQPRTTSSPKEPASAPASSPASAPRERPAQRSTPETSPVVVTTSEPVPVRRSRPKRPARQRVPGE